MKIMETISTYYIVTPHLRKYTCETHDQEQPCKSKCFAITCIHFFLQKQPFVLLQVNTAHKHMSLHTYNFDFFKSYIINNSNYLWSTWRCIKNFLCIYDHSNNIFFNKFMTAQSKIHCTDTLSLLWSDHNLSSLLMHFPLLFTNLLKKLVGFSSWIYALTTSFVYSLDGLS